jgi:hypothetical protein
VGVAVFVAVNVMVGVMVFVAVNVIVGVLVAVKVNVTVGVQLDVAVNVAEGVSVVVAVPVTVFVQVEVDLESVPLSGLVGLSFFFLQAVAMNPADRNAMRTVKNQRRNMNHLKFFSFG